MPQYPKSKTATSKVRKLVAMAAVLKILRDTILLASAPSAPGGDRARQQPQGSLRGPHCTAASSSGTGSGMNGNVQPPPRASLCSAAVFVANLPVGRVRFAPLRSLNNNANLHRIPASPSTSKIAKTHHQPTRAQMASQTVKLEHNRHLVFQVLLSSSSPHRSM